MKLQDLREFIELDTEALILQEWDWKRFLRRSSPDDAPTNSPIRHLDGYTPGMLPYGGQGYWRPRRDPWGDYHTWPPNPNSPGTQYHPPRSGPALYGPNHGFHPNSMNWYWDSQTGGWVRVPPGAPMPPGVRFPQPSAPNGSPGFQYPHHSPNGYPVGPDGQEMPVNPDTGEPWTHDPYTNEPYGNPPPWDANPPGSGGYPDWNPPSTPGGIDVEVQNTPGGDYIVPINPMGTNPNKSGIPDPPEGRQGYQMPSRPEGGYAGGMPPELVVRPPVDQNTVTTPNRYMGGIG